MIIFYCEYIPKNFITRSVIPRIPKFKNELKEHQSQWRSQGHCFGEASSKRRRHSRVSAPQLLHGFSRLFEWSPPPPSTLTTPLIKQIKEGFKILVAKLNQVGRVVAAYEAHVVETIVRPNVVERHGKQHLFGSDIKRYLYRNCAV